MLREIKVGLSPPSKISLFPLENIGRKSEEHLTYKNAQTPQRKPFFSRNLSFPQLSHALYIAKKLELDLLQDLSGLQDCSALG
jgi:hypothetical protein